MMADGVAIYRVSDETFVATGPIPPTCIRGIWTSESGEFKPMYVSSVSTVSSHRRSFAFPSKEC